jgi:hypothetical protein
MKRTAHILKGLVIVALAAVWIQTSAHDVTSHGEDAECGHETTETVCTCVCHVALESHMHPGLCLTSDAEKNSSIYVTSSGISLPTDIFRPPTR